MTDPASRSRKIALICGAILGTAAPIAFLYAPNFRMTWMNAGILAALAIPLASFRGSRRSYLKGLLAGVVLDLVGAFLFLAIAGMPRMG